MSTYTADCSWEDGWWVITVIELDSATTQARRLEQVDAQVRSLIGLFSNDDPAEATVAVSYQLDSRIQSALDHAKAEREEADAHAAAATLARQQAAAAMQAGGLTVRDIGQVLDVSHQRAAQILGGGASGQRAAARTGAPRAAEATGRAAYFE